MHGFRGPSLNNETRNAEAEKLSPIMNALTNEFYPDIKGILNYCFWKNDCLFSLWLFLYV